MFLYDLLNGRVDSPGLLSIIGFYISQINFRVNKLFYVPFITTNYGSASYFPRVLILANKIANFVDFFLYAREVFKRNGYSG